MHVLTVIPNLLFSRNITQIHMHCTPIGLVDFSSDGLDVLINDINDTRREKSPSNKTPGLAKSTNIDI